MFFKVLCCMFVISTLTLTMTSGLRCYTCSDMKNCYETTECADEYFCAKFDITTIGNLKKTLRECVALNPCEVLNAAPFTQANCYLCNKNLCNGIEKKSFNILIGISCLVAIYTFSKRLL